MVNSTITSNTSDLKKIPVWKNASFWHIAALMVACSIFYYMDVIINFGGWMNLRYEIFYTVHDLHRAFFLIPVMYAAYAFRQKGIIITSFISLLIFLPRAMFVSPYPDPLLRAIIFIISMIIMGVFLSLLLDNINKRKGLEQDLSHAHKDLLLKQTEDTLHEAEDKYKKLIDNIPDIIFTIDLEGKITFVSKRTTEILGYENAETINMNIFNFIPEEDHQRAMEYLQKGMKGEKIRNFQIPLITKSGEILIFECSFSRVYKDGAVIGAQGTAVDITERKRMERMLMERDALFAKISSQAPGMLYQFARKPDGSYSVPFSSDGVREIFGCSPKDVRDNFEPIFQAIFPEDRNKILQTIEESAKNILPWTCEYRVQLHGKPVKWILGNSIPEKMADGTIVWSGYNTDITQRKEMEFQQEAAVEALRESERQYRNLFDSFMEGIFQTTPQGKLIKVNPAFARMFGYESSEEIIGVVVDIAGQLYALPDERKKIVNTLKENGYLKDYECKMRRKDGTIFWTLINARLIESKDGQRYFEGFTIDITERKRAEEEVNRLNEGLEQKVAERTRELHDSQLALLNLVDDLNQNAKNTDLINRKLEETNNELKAFSYSVSHDLRAPLRSIDGFSLALLEDYEKNLDDTGRNYLNKIRAATQHMGLLIEDMLKLSRISHAAFHHESIDLSKIVQSIAKTLQQSNPDEDMKMTIQEGMVIRGDLNAMQIALTNLLENAWKFTGKQNNPMIEFGMTIKDGEKIFFIRDNGVGFDMAYVDKLFGAFQRLHGQDDFPGTGIGLATVKRIITRHGGQIWAEGEVGNGATFFFTLPE